MMANGRPRIARNAFKAVVRRKQDAVCTAAETDMTLVVRVVT